MLFDVTNVCFTVGNTQILDNINLQVTAGQSLLLLGPSGSGKTSLLNILAGLSQPAGGEIKFNGQTYSSLSRSDPDRLRAENFGFVFQKLLLIGHLSVEQNIALSQNKADHQRIKDLITDLGLSGKEKQKARDLSVGEAQRVAIARAVVHNPKVIFADEPTSALDDVNATKVMNLIFDQAKKSGATVIAATHDARIKGMFDNILEIA